MKYITIDMGTTNTRVRCVENSEILAEYSTNIGVRNSSLENSKDSIKNCIKTGINCCLNEVSTSIDEIEAVIASGMITSDMGLIEIPHIEVPVGINDLHNNIVTKLFPDICRKAISFIPGVKNRTSEVADIDIMRGEETEAIGAVISSNIEGEVLFVSPGSHTKFVHIDENKKIKSCSTTLSGEMLWALYSSTLLSDSIDKDLITEIDRSYIKQGFESANLNGLTKTLFLTRILDKFKEATPNQCANFIMGAIGYSDIFSIRSLIAEEQKVLIGGSEVLRSLYFEVFKLFGISENQIIKMENETQRLNTSIGAIEVAKYSG